MNFTITVWHLNHTLAVARGMASHTEHKAPYVGATCMHTAQDKEDVQRLWDAHCYVPVAIVTYNSAADFDEAMEFAFEKTNHIEEAWDRQENFNKELGWRIKPVRINGNRSTSVGDVFEIADTTYVTSMGMWKQYAVLPCGFQLLKRS